MKKSLVQTCDKISKLKQFLCISMFHHKSKKKFIPYLENFCESYALDIVFVLSKPGLILRTDLTPTKENQRGV
jgi:hypothetical protein